MFPLGGAEGPDIDDIWVGAEGAEKIFANFGWFSSKNG